MKTTCPLIPLLIWTLLSPTFGQNRSERPTGAVLDIDIRFQKSVSFYIENGVMAQCTNPKPAPQRLYSGLSYVTSRLGTALGSSAIKQANFLHTASYHFRPTWLIQPVFKANAGYFKADYSSALFDEFCAD